MSIALHHPDQQPKLLPEGQASKKAVTKAADRVSKALAGQSTVERKRAVIQDVVDEIRNDPSNFHVPVAITTFEVQYHEAYLDIVSRIRELVTPYQEGGIDLINGHQDAVQLQANLVALTAHLADFQRLAYEAEGALETVRARISLRAKDISDRERARLTDQDSKDLSRSETADLQAQMVANQGVRDFLYNVYMATRDFVQILNAAAEREVRVNTPLRGSS